MDITEIPFVKKMGIARTRPGTLELFFDDSLHNHVQTMHASAQFALAETASGEYLQRLFPDLDGQVVPVLRDSQIKFKKPANKTIRAHPSVSDEAANKFREQLEKKGRSSISVNVEVKDTENVVTCTGVFNWFVQKM